MRNDEILHMQVRLFRLAGRKWNKSTIECADVFDKYSVDQYIRDSYEFFHVQGDEANIEDIEEYLERKGCNL